MRFQVKKVRGCQAEQVKKRLNLVKITRDSARDLYEVFGIPLVVAPSKVNSFHFFGGWHLAFHVNCQRYVYEDWTFDKFVANWSIYNEHAETGKIAFFVEQKYVI